MNALFQAGSAVREITPSREIVNNSLHSCMAVRFDEPGSPLRVKALALSFQGETRMLLAIDLVLVPRSQARMIRQAVAQATGWNAEQIVLSASHSHSTPFLEPLDGPHPFLDFVTRQCVAAAAEAAQTRRAARVGHGTVHVVGASFNTRVPLADGGVKFTRDFREGLASGRPVDPRLSVVRVDDENGQPMAGWVRFAAHPACVIFDAPISAEYPGYLTDRLSALCNGHPPFLFGYGSAGDVNCVPMFGAENDARCLGRQLADLVAPVFDSIQTNPPARFLAGLTSIPLPLDPPPSAETLDREIQAVEQFQAALAENPGLIWVLGINCGENWSVEKKRAHVEPLAEWARRVKKRLAAGQSFPAAWPREVAVWILDDLGLVFDSGEPFVEIGLALAARSSLKETLLVAICNGADAYLGADADRRRGGYELYTSTRYALLADGTQPLPYALGAAEVFIDATLELIKKLVKKEEA